MVFLPSKRVGANRGVSCQTDPERDVWAGFVARHVPVERTSLCHSERSGRQAARVPGSD